MMRLNTIKLAGFKSFVDPTVLDFQTNLTAIVGPNGCGKSNIVDAIRWVIGESSAKNLRAESMTDVIFNGTTNRKPVGQASIELIFDNADGGAGGEYAKYSEISVRRVLQRDGQSAYSLNNTRCRRKDILDLFLGTGLGPRSYSIIEQGMISRLIEAKPVDLRVFLEEAAGISKYKERRKETETRIRHTRENLDRLADLRQELEKQLSHLKRQANAAERYKVLKQEYRTLKAQLHCLQLMALEDSIKDKRIQLQRGETDLAAKLAEQQHLETDLEKTRIQFTELHDQVDEIQKQFYGIGSDIARIEQQINHINERKHQVTNDLNRVQSQLSDLDQQHEQDVMQLQDAETELDHLTNQVNDLLAEVESDKNESQQAQARLSEVQQQWENAQQSFSDAQRKAEVARTRYEHLQSQSQRLKERREQLSTTLQTIDIQQLQTSIDLHEEKEQSQKNALSTQQELLATIIGNIHELRSQHQQAQNALHHSQRALSQLEARQSSLNHLQDVALGKTDEKHHQWLSTHGLADAQRLGEQIHVAEGWERAVETVLGDVIEAVCIDDFTAVAGNIGNLDEANLSFINTNYDEQVDSNSTLTSLAEKITTSLPLKSFLSTIYIAEDINDALAKRSQLKSNESIITRDGIWLSQLWLKVRHAVDDHSGVLQRQQELKTISEEIQQQEALISEQQEQVSQLRDAIQQAEQEREQQQQSIQTIAQQHSDIRADLSAKLSEMQQLEKRQANLDQELSEVTDQLETAQNQLVDIEREFNTAESSFAELQAQQAHLNDQRIAVKETYNETQKRCTLTQQRADEMQIRVESTRSQIHYLQQGINRAEQQRTSLRHRLEELQLESDTIANPLPNLETELETKLSQRLTIEQKLTEAKQAYSQIENTQRQYEKQRDDCIHQIQHLRESLESIRTAVETAKVKIQTHLEQIDETGLDRQQTLAELPEEANISDWQEQIENTEVRIQRLGNINLAAIDEYQEVCERKQYLDQQDSDLNEALETLEGAIRKIDRETRNRFKETFDLVNDHFKTYFPSIFGGGQACLELTDDNLLETGIQVKAQPPGKRNSTIHMLSGGEKALTAIALVFSFFQLNPAPFCVLDEVDAPLDDANVVRYCNLVKQMSDKVQFIFISHNKVAIEMAKQLAGVTMREPGVSRLVSVDIDQAIDMATA